MQCQLRVHPLIPPSSFRLVQDIYDNTAETRESFVSFWRYVASVFSGANGVFGYELMNEPWAGNVAEDLSLMLPGVAGRRNLAPMYERVGRSAKSIH